MLEDTTSDSFDLYFSVSLVAPNFLHDIEQLLYGLTVGSTQFFQIKGEKTNQELKGYAFHLCLCKQIQ